MKQRVLLSLGSNTRLALPHRVLSPCQILQEAVSVLRSTLDGMVCSSVYQTAAMYVTCQSDFFNMAAAGETSLSAHGLLDAIHRAEASFGRDRSREVRNGPRTLDIDIVLFGKETICDDNLVIPHPRMLERAFVLLPALEILRASPNLQAAWPLSLSDFEAAALAVKGQRCERCIPA